MFETNVNDATGGAVFADAACVATPFELVVDDDDVAIVDVIAGRADADLPALLLLLLFDGG